MPLVPESYWLCAEDTYWGGHPVLNSGVLRWRVATDCRHQWWTPQTSSWHHHQHEQLHQWCHPVEAVVRALLRSTIFSTADSAVRPAGAMSGDGWTDASGSPDGHLALVGANPCVPVVKDHRVATHIWCGDPSSDRNFSRIASATFSRNSEVSAI